jgi:hypothetical protein
LDQAAHDKLDGEQLSLRRKTGIREHVKGIRVHHAQPRGGGTARLLGPLILLEEREQGGISGVGGVSEIGKIGDVALFVNRGLLVCCKRSGSLRRA